MEKSLPPIPHAPLPASPESTLAIIPALNEQESIQSVIENLRKYGIQHIRVIDNGSTDLTAEKARLSKAEIIEEPEKGYGQACWTGLQNLPHQIQWILFCDADGSDDLTHLPEFLQKTSSHELILGNRQATSLGKKNLTPVQRFGNALAGFLIGLVWGRKFHDLGPLRLIKRSALEKLHMEDRGFGWTVEMQTKAAAQNLSICEIPVNYLPRQAGKSKISGTLSGSVKAGYIILSTLASLWIQKKSTQTSLKLLSTILLLAGTLLMLPNGDFREPSQTQFFLMASALMGSGFFLTWFIRTLHLLHFWGMALFLRLLLLFMYPGDDIWRYLWEGHIQWHGFSPYQLPPADPALENLRTEWWNQINHPTVSAIYPPLAQFLFKLFSFLSLSPFFFKLIFTLADISILALLVRRFGTLKSLIYAWNPAVIYSFAGGGHYDSLFILPLVGACLLSDQKIHRKSLLLGASVAMKWVSAPLLAFHLWNCLKKQGIAHTIRSSMVSILPFILTYPLVAQFQWDEPLIPTAFAYYARSAECFPWLVSLIWEKSLDLNPIFIAPVALMSLTLVFLKSRLNQTLETFAENFFFFLLILSPVFHAWYLTWLIPFSLKSRNLGARLMSITVFIYFILQYRQHASSPPPPWVQTPWEKAILWLPLILGFIWTFYARRPSPPTPQKSTP